MDVHLFTPFAPCFNFAVIPGFVPAGEYRNFEALRNEMEILIPNYGNETIGNR